MGMRVHPDAVHRTAKMFADSGEAASLKAAAATLAGYVLQVYVGAEVATSRTMLATVTTAVNAAARAFLGGVRVQLTADPRLTFGWDAGQLLSVAVQRHGGTLVAELRDDAPTICIGDPGRGVRGQPILRATHDGWTAGVVEGSATPLPERDYFIPAGVAAAGIAVGEAFQYRRGDVHAGRRSQGISLWCPGVDWLSAAASGPDDVDIAPSRWWVIGLGHLGQAYLWTIGLLPYANPATIQILLQDDDCITEANESTGLLTRTGWTRRRKTRALAELLEARGLATAVSERRFERGQRPVGEEPRLALVGVDNPETRALLSDAGFDAVIDAGLGGGPLHYLDMQTHVFPAGRRSDEIPAWRAAPMDDARLLELPAYKELARDSGDRCGTVQVAGRSVAAAFVGATASALVVAEATRLLLDQHRFAVVDASLRDLSSVAAVPAIGLPPVYPGSERLL
jgi:hypothetical protein